MNKLHFSIKNMKHNATENPHFHLYRPFGMEEYLFLLFKSYGEMVINYKRYPYEPNMFVILSPKTLHEINTLDNVLIHDYIIFTVNDENLFDTNILYNKMRFHSKAANLSELIKILFQEYLYPDHKSVPIIDELMNTILTYSQANRISQHSFTRHELKIKSRFDEIRNSFYSQKYFPDNIKEVADKLFLSESRFAHLYSKFYTVSPAKDILNFKIQYAKELLEFTDLTVSDISEKCGFSSETVFIRTFKRLTKVSPGKWK